VDLTVEVAAKVAILEAGGARAKTPVPGGIARSTTRNPRISIAGIKGAFIWIHRCLLSGTMHLILYIVDISATWLHPNAT
jgi:hypothetical protein